MSLIDPKLAADYAHAMATETLIALVQRHIAAEEAREGER